MPTALRACAYWLRPDAARIDTRNVLLRSPLGLTRITRIAPKRLRPGERLPVYIALHGTSALGPDHPVLRVFMEGLAAAQCIVLMPEYRPWMELSLSTDDVDDTLRSAVGVALDDPVVDSSRIGLIGVSFATPQVLIAAGSPGLREHVSTVVGFGGYHDFTPVLRYMLTGEDPSREPRCGWARPHVDPYGRWVVAMNLLPMIEELGRTDGVVGALRTLLFAGSGLHPTGSSAAYDPLKTEVRRELDAPQQRLFDLIAPRSFTPPDDTQRAELEVLTEQFLGVIRKLSVRANPMEYISSLPRLVSLIHGRNDPLIPANQSARLAEALTAHTCTDLLITRLVEHSTQSVIRSPLAFTVEWWRAATFMRRTLAVLS